MKRIEKIAVLGGGLLGGSLALRLSAGHHCSLWARREAAVAEARSLGIQAATASLEAAVDGADLIVMTIPVGAMPALVERLLEIGLCENCLITDVGSVKRVVHETAGTRLREAGHHFIGGHPMAGSEARGVGSARADLFDGAACLLTDDDRVGQPWAALLEDFWVEVGCRVRWMNASEHDRLVARISHFPHVMAAATAGIALQDPGDARFGGGGLRDTTRVAGGDPGMWAEILLENREAVAAAVGAAKDSLTDILAMLERDDHEAVVAWLADSQRLHQAGQAAKDDELHG